MHPTRRVVAVLAALLTALAAAVVPSAPAAAESYVIDDRASCENTAAAVGGTATWAESGPSKTCTFADGRLAPVDGLTAGSGVSLHFEGFTNGGGVAAGRLFAALERPYTNTGLTEFDEGINHSEVFNEGVWISRDRYTVNAPFVNSGTVRAEGSTWVVAGLLDNVGGTITVACGVAFNFLSSGRFSGAPPVFECGPKDIALSGATMRVTTPPGHLVGTLSTAESTGEGPYTYSVVSGGDEFQVEGDALRTAAPLPAGEHRVTVRVAGARGAFHDEELVVTVEKLAQSVAFTSTAPADGQARTGGTYSPTAASDAGLPVVFGTATPGVCSVSGGVVSLLRPGTCTVTADQAGDAQHAAAERVSQTFRVGAAGQASLTARASSPTGFNAAGWSRSPVTVTFACAPSPGATLTGPCPLTKVKERQVRNRVVSRTITDSFGQSATASVVVKIDRVDPVVRVRGVRDGATYDEARRVRCRAWDAFSGLRGCRVSTRKVARADGTTVIRYRLVAEDVAGNRAVRSGRYHLR